MTEGGEKTISRRNFLGLIARVGAAVGLGSAVGCAPDISKLPKPTPRPDQLPVAGGKPIEEKEYDNLVKQGEADKKSREQLEGERKELERWLKDKIGEFEVRNIDLNNPLKTGRFQITASDGSNVRSLPLVLEETEIGTVNSGQRIYDVRFKVSIINPQTSELNEWLAVKFQDLKKAYLPDEVCNVDPSRSKYRNERGFVFICQRIGSEVYASSY